MPLLFPLLLSAALFGIGLYGVLARRNAVLALIGVELMLNAVNVQLVAYDAWLGDEAHTGQVFTLYVIALAAAEIGLGLAIVLALFRARGTIDVDDVERLS
jgi:NADH-quinone oxidoreductase subunit K